MAIKTTKEKVLEIMHKPEQIRNIGIIAHIDHGKTTLSDNVLAGAGMISEELAGKQLYLDFDEQEQARGITINAANVSMVYELDNREYLINLIDTPGHIDFSGDVTRAMRAVDGAVVVCCAVEGVMPQTETVLRQALKERVKPILFINKVDRLIREIKLTPEKMQAQFIGIINGVNAIIRAIAPPEYKEKWQVSVKDGSVAFGSAYHKWALSAPVMQKKGISFKDIITAYESEEWKNLFKRAPLHEVFLNMVVKHLPNPIEAQKYRIPQIWHGEIDSEVGRSLLSCNEAGPLVFVVTKVIIDPHAGEVATGRLFSGEIKKAQEVYLNLNKSQQRVQQVSIYRGPQRIIIDEIPAGNIAGIVGLHDARSGETVSTEPIVSFESIKHLFEPVVVKAMEAKNPKDLPKLIEVLKQIEKEDPTIAVKTNEETGENLISGLGELHLEIWEYRIRKDRGIDVVTSSPIVVYRETVERSVGPVEGKSPNKHNKLYVIVEPLEDSVYQAIKAGEIAEMRIKKKKKDVIEKLVKAGMSTDDAKKVRDVYRGNVLLDDTRGIVHIGEIIEMVMEAFEEISDAGPLTKEPSISLKIKLKDAKLHEDNIHRGPAQIIPAMRQAVMNAMLIAGDVLYEPKQTIRIDAPVDYLGAVSKMVQSRRGQLLETQQEADHLTIRAKLPVAEMFGFTSTLRSTTAGRGAWFLIDQGFEKLPNELQSTIIMRIRDRKGLKKEIPKPQI